MSLRIAPFAVASVVLVSGCAPATSPAPATPAKTPTATQAQPDHDAHDHDHDHGHDHEGHTAPKTVAEALAQLEKCWAETKAHLAAGDHDKADEPVHMVGHLLEDLGDLVAKEKPAVEAEARKAADALFDCFDKIDTAIHAADDEVRRKFDVAEHSPAVEAAIARLKSLVPSP